MARPVIVHTRREFLRSASLTAGAVAAPQIVATDDPVVLALPHPREQLAHALDGQRMRHLEVLEQP